MADIKYSKHARSRMVERGISASEVSEAVRKGRKFAKDKNIHAVFRHIEVVMRKADGDWYVVTVMLRW